mmetsp:Transcript_23213/g.75059  ORF Transcript_23213/g.75059 Transcript_23213/m.75059 type:complete len:336 (+) Transcript_23213:275-1282(+)
MSVRAAPGVVQQFAQAAAPIVSQTFPGSCHVAPIQYGRRMSVGGMSSPMVMLSVMSTPPVTLSGQAMPVVSVAAPAVSSALPVVQGIAAAPVMSTTTANHTVVTLAPRIVSAVSASAPAAAVSVASMRAAPVATTIMAMPPRPPSPAPTEAAPPFRRPGELAADALAPHEQGMLQARVLGDACNAGAVAPALLSRGPMQACFLGSGMASFGMEQARMASTVSYADAYGAAAYGSRDPIGGSFTAIAGRTLTEEEAPSSEELLRGGHLVSERYVHKEDLYREGYLRETYPEVRACDNSYDHKERYDGDMRTQPAVREMSTFPAVGEMMPLPAKQVY